MLSPGFYSTGKYVLFQFLFLNSILYLVSSFNFFLCLYVLNSWCSFLGDYPGRLGGHHVLCDGCSLLLQLHLLHPAHHCKYICTRLKKRVNWGCEHPPIMCECRLYTRWT